MTTSNLDVVSDITGATVIDGNTYTIKGTASDDASGINTIAYKLDNGDYVSDGITLSGTNWSLPVQLGDGGIGEGKHTIQISAGRQAAILEQP